MKGRSERVERVRRHLEESGIDFDLRQLEDNTQTAVMAAAALSCSVAEIAKSIVFKRRGDDGDKPPIIAVLCGDNRVCPDKLARLVGDALDKADADFVKARCGFEIGGVAPLAHRRPAEVFLENGLRRFPVIWAAAGSAYTVFGTAPEAMAQAAGATFADFAVVAFPTSR